MPSFTILSRNSLCFAALATTLAVCARPGSAIELNRADRLSIHPSEATEITFTGIDLRNQENQAAQIWTSFPADVQPIDGGDQPDRNRVRYRVIPKGPVAGVVAIRAFTKDAISKTLFLIADDNVAQPIPAEFERSITIPATLEADSRGLGEQIVPIECGKGATFIAEVISGRIGSEMDAVLILLDKEKREIAFADDHPVTGSDPILKHTPTYQGLHYLVVRDVQYRGGYRFQLRLSDRSLSSILFPPAIRRGETRQVVQSPVEAVHLAEGEPFELASGRWLGLRDAGQASLGNLYCTDLPVYVEGAVEPLPVSSIYCGVIAAEDEVDGFTFAATAGERITIDVRPGQIGSPLVPNIEVHRNDATPLAQHNWAADPRGRLRMEMKESGLYRVSISDVLHRGGPYFRYFVSVRNDAAPFEIKLVKGKKKRQHPNRISMVQGEPIDLKLRIERRGYGGPVTITARTEDGETCPVADGVVAEKATEADVRISLPGAVSEPTLRHIHIVGQCTIDGRKFFAPLDLTEYAARETPSMPSLPGYVASYLPVVINPAEADTKN